MKIFRIIFSIFLLTQITNVYAQDSTDSLYIVTASTNPGDGTSISMDGSPISLNSPTIYFEKPNYIVYYINGHPTNVRYITLENGYWDETLDNYISNSTVYISVIAILNTGFIVDYDPCNSFNFHAGWDNSWAMNTVDWYFSDSTASTRTFFKTTDANVIFSRSDIPSDILPADITKPRRFYIWGKPKNGDWTFSSITLYPSTLTSFTANSTAPLCYGSPGSITISDLKYSDGTPYSANQNLGINVYDNADGVNPIQGTTVFDNEASKALALNPGTYWIKIFNAYACVASLVQVTVPPTTQVISSLTGQNPTCSTGTGTLTASASGGVGGYKYSLNNGAYQASNIFTGLAAGNYSVKTMDANGCESSQSNTVTITVPPAVTVSLNSQSNPSGFGRSDGQIVVTPTGGSGSGYTYKLNGINVGSSPTIGNLSAGSYTVVAIDNAGCPSPGLVVTISQPDLLALQMSSKVNATCFDAADGVINLTASGGTAPYTYSLNGGSYQSISSFSNLAAGNYTLFVLDQFNNSAQISAAVSQPTKVTASITIVSPLCFGDLSGSISLIASGGSLSGYTYSINNGLSYSATSSFTGLAAGSYNIRIKDDTDCVSDEYPIIITEPALLSFVVNKTDVLCKDAANGKITISGTGGTLPYSYRVNGGSWVTNNVIENLSPGNYIITAKDQPDCVSYTTTITINEPEKLKLVVDELINAPCFGSKGSVSVFSTGGSGIITYSAIPYLPVLNGVFSPLAGSYTIIATDENGCTSELLITITQPTLITPAAVITPVACYGESNGKVVLSATNGSGSGYLFAGSDGVYSSSGEFSGLAAGDYVFTIKDGTSCEVTYQVHVPEPDIIVLQSKNLVNVSCFGFKTGSFESDVSGGNGGYTYTLDGLNKGSNTSYSGLAAGNHTLVVTDSKGCFKTIIVSISQPDILGASLNLTHVLCKGQATGIISAQGLNGTAPYQYALTSTNNFPEEFTTNNLFTGLLAGTYTIWIKDAQGCIYSTGGTVAEPLISVTATGLATQLTCYDANDGTVLLTAYGGVAPYLYSIDGTGYSTNYFFENLVSGNHAFLVKDANNCTYSFNVNVPSPAIIQAVVNKIDIACNGDASGKITLNTTGGNGDYIYSMDGINYRSGNTFNNLIAGTYQIIIKDSKQCLATITVTLINLYQPLSFDITAVEPLECDDKGTLTIANVAGGKAPYQYSVDGVSYVASPIFIDLVPGSYNLFVKDDNGCIAIKEYKPFGPISIVGSVTISNNQCYAGEEGTISISNITGGNNSYEYSINGGSFQASSIFAGLKAGNYQVILRDVPYSCQTLVSVIITEPLQLSLTAANIHPVTCDGLTDGSVTISPNGGSGTYQYAIDNGSYSSNSAFINLPAGTHILHLRDFNYPQCEINQSITISSPDKLEFTYTKSDLTCNESGDGSIFISATGGTAPYRYSINGVSQSSPLFRGLQAGTYTIIVSDGNNCSGTATVGISAPEKLSISLISSTNITCTGYSNGFIKVSANGGTAPFLYNIDNKGYQNDNTFSNLLSGIHLITVKDAQGCTNIINITLTQPEPLVLNLKSKQNVSCYAAANGSIDLDAVGGNGNYQYAIDGQNYQVSGKFSNLNGGNYAVYVKDALGCVGELVVNIIEPALFVVKKVVVNPNCFGSCDGEISFETSGGTSPYTYSWITNPSIGNQPKATSLCKGIYQVLIADANGCSSMQRIELIDPAEIKIEGIKDSTLCKGQVIQFYAANPGLKYLWSSDNGFSSTQEMATLSESGNYKLTVTNAVGCSVSKSFMITVSTNLLKADFLMSSVVALGDTILVIDVSKPTPSKISWTLSAGARELSSNVSGTIKQILFDAIGDYNVGMTVNLSECADAIQKTITVKPKEQKNEINTALGYKEDLLKSFKALPNPSTGRFRAAIELSQKANVKVRLINFISNQIVDVQEARDQDYYELEFYHPELIPGIYILTLEVGNIVKTLKIIKI